MSHLTTARAVAKATRLQGADAVASKSGLHARVTYDGRTLAFVRQQKKAISVHIQDYGTERRERVATIAEAAKLVKTSERRQPKTAK
jgi:hypothetical protein